MKMIYLSHPYTGDELKNIADADEYTKRLSEKFSDMIFINPLDTMKHMVGMDYDIILNQCIELLNRCDYAIMLGDWKNSKGCMAELKNAQIPVFDGVDAFINNVILNKGKEENQSNVKPSAFDSGGLCNKVTLWISYELLAKMLCNCPYSDERDNLIRHLRKMHKSKNLEQWLNKEKIWDLVSLYW